MASQRPGFARADTDAATAPVDGIEMSPVRASGSESSLDKKRNSTEKGVVVEEHGLPTYDGEHDAGGTAVLSTAEDLITNILTVADDPTLNPWTFRMWFLGIGLSLFGSTLACIYYFKPQTVFVSVIFLAVISYVLGELMAAIIPKGGWIGRWFNPHPFNSKEHVAIVIMSSSAATCALGVEVLAVQKLYYSSSPNAGASIFLLFASQLLGYGFAGIYRQTLVYPTKMLYPQNLPLNTLLETLHRDKQETKERLRVFYIGFACLFVWEVFPEYIAPILTGVSIFCLAKRDSLVFTNLFGGTNGNEGLGLLSFCTDWQYIAGLTSPLWYPLQTLNNNFVGYILCIVVFMGVYYGNVWNAQDFPFLSQLLFDPASNSTNFIQYNQSALLDANNEVDPTKIDTLGVPYFTATYAVSLLTNNLAITSTFTHMMLWNYDDMKSAWEVCSPRNLKKAFAKKDAFKFWKKSEELDPMRDPSNPDLDPHYRLMLAYEEVPQWWYIATLVFSVVVGLVCLYQTNSTLPWWGFFIACILSMLCVLFFGAMNAITGFYATVQNVIQMIGGYLHPGKPVANMYFTLFGYNSILQGIFMLRDLKLGQYAHLPPRCTFVVQMVGTCVGAVFNYIMMVSIVENQREILLSIQGTNIWSGQNVQQYNSQAIAWGGLANHLFNVGQRYEWIPLSFLIGFIIPLPFWGLHKLFPRAGFSYWNTAIITWYIGWLCVGINSSILTFFLVGWFSQFYLRKYKPAFFIKYNYILSAAMDGGTQVIVFIMTFAVFGGSGKSVPFPLWWANNAGDDTYSANFDYCMRA